MLPRAFARASKGPICERKHSRDGREDGAWGGIIAMHVSRVFFGVRKILSGFPQNVALLTSIVVLWLADFA